MLSLWYNVPFLCLLPFSRYRDRKVVMRLQPPGVSLSSGALTYGELSLIAPSYLTSIVCDYFFLIASPCGKIEIIIYTKLNCF